MRRRAKAPDLTDGLNGGLIELLIAGGPDELHAKQCPVAAYVDPDDGLGVAPKPARAATGDLCTDRAAPFGHQGVARRLGECGLLRGALPACGGAAT